MTFTLRRKSRRHTPRHVALLSAPENEETLPEAVRRAEAEEKAAAMTQAIPNGVPDGARWAEDIPVIRQPMRRTGPQRRTPTGPQRAVPSGANPYAAPVTRTGPQREVRYAPASRPRTARHTEAWTPDFAEQGSRPRPYAPRNNPPRPMPRIPDTWRRQAHPMTQQGRGQAEFVQDRMQDIVYPAPDASPSEVARFFFRVSVITGTSSSYERPFRCVAWARGITEGAA